MDNNQITGALSITQNLIQHVMCHVCIQGETPHSRKVGMWCHVHQMNTEQDMRPETGGTLYSSQVQFQYIWCRRC
jgi:hypothetical protein